MIGSSRPNCFLMIFFSSDVIEGVNMNELGSLGITLNRAKMMVITIKKVIMICMTLFKIYFPIILVQKKVLTLLRTPY